MDAQVLDLSSAFCGESEICYYFDEMKWNYLGGLAGWYEDRFLD